MLSRPTRPTSFSLSNQRYHKVGVKSSIDRGLFGMPDHVKQKRKLRNSDKKTSNEHEAQEAIRHEALYVRCNEIADIKNRLMSLQDKEEKRVSLTDNEAKGGVSKDHNIDSVKTNENANRNRKRRGRQPPSAKSIALRAKLQERSDEQSDIGKILREYSERALAFTILDRQRGDTKLKKDQEKAYEHRMNLVMEVDRIKEIQLRQAEDDEKERRSIDGRRTIEDQIEYRRQQRLLQEESRYQENLRFARMMKLQEQEDNCNAEIRRKERMKTHSEIQIANQMTIVMRQTRKSMEREEDERMLAYQLAKDVEMRKRQENEAQAFRQKIEMQSKMLESQSKILDDQQQNDELWHRRAEEETERKYRERILREAQKRKHDVLALNKARKLQEQEKREAKLADEAMKKGEYMSALQMARIMASRECQEAQIRQQKNEIFLRGLQEQMRNRQRDISQSEKSEEGLRVKAELTKERIRLEAIRDKHVAALRSKGVDEKYLAEILSINIEKLQKAF